MRNIKREQRLDKERQNKKDFIIRHWLAVWTVVALILIISTWGIYIGQEKQTQEVSVQYTTDITSGEKEEEDQDNYSDNIFQLTISVLVAVETISITIFTFLKSLLDRNTDKRNYSRKVMSSYNEQMSRVLEILTIDSILLVVYGFVFYSSRFFRFRFEYFHWICGWLIPILIFTGCSVLFWRRCIDINTSWRKIAEEKILAEEKKLQLIIESPDIERLVKNCENDIEWKHFIYLFTKLEEFLILGIDSNYSVYTDGEEKIKDHLRQSEHVINNKLNAIEENDLKQESVFVELNEMRKEYSKVGLDIPQLYESLENCRDYLLVNMFYTRESIDSDQDTTVQQNALKLFYQKMLIEKFRNLVIDGIIFENPEFIYIDLYGARIENSILTGAVFKKGILARIQIQNTNLTMGYYDNTLIKDARVTGSSFLSSYFFNTKMEKTKFMDTELSNSSFIMGSIEESTFQNSNLSDSEFIDTPIIKADFSDTILHNIEFKGNTTIVDSSFIRAEISKWKIEADMLKPFQNFTEAVMTGFELGNDYTNMDASGDIFTGAVIYDGKFKNLTMTGCIFENCNMTRIKMENVAAVSSNMRGVNLYSAEIKGIPSAASVSSFHDCDLTNANAVKAVIINTDFHGAICIGMDLSDAEITDGDWSGAEMGKAILSGAKITGVNFEKANFTEAVMGNTEFIKCDFKGAVFLNTLISGARFVECDLSGVSFEHFSGMGFTLENCLM